MTRWEIIKRLAVVSTVLLLALNWVAFFEIERPTGARLLDLRFMGYDQAAALEFASGLNSETRDSYRRAYLVLDTAFIGFFFSFLWMLAQHFKPARYWWLIASGGALYAAADLGENYFVSRLIVGGAGTIEWYAPFATALLGESENGAIAAVLTRIKFLSLILIATAITIARKTRADNS